MSDIDQMASQFKSFEELKIYSDAQYRTILTQSKRINQLEDEVVELKKLIDQMVPKDPSVKSDLIISAGSDEEYICRIQLNELKKAAQDRELTLEETKKVEIYSKLLMQITGKSQDEKKEAEKPISNEELIAFLEKGNLGGNS